MVFLTVNFTIDVVIQNGVVNTFFEAGLPMTKDQYDFQGQRQHVWKLHFQVVEKEIIKTIYSWTKLLNHFNF